MWMTIKNKYYVNTDRLTRHSIKAPFELLHADIADIRFFLNILLICNSFGKWFDGF